MLSRSTSDRAPSRSARQILLLLLATAVGVVGLLPLMSPAVAATLPGLEGDGSAADPMQIDTAADLDAAAKAVATDAATFGSLSYRLDADIDYGGGTFDGFGTFSGTFNGDGHSISNLVYSNANNAVSFFGTLTGATVTGLTLRNATGTTSTGDASAGLIAVSAANSTITGNTVLDSSVRLGPGGAVNTQAGGLVAAATGATVVSDNLLWNVSVRGHKYAAGLVTYPRAGAVEVARNLMVDVTVLSDAGGSGATAGLLIAQGGVGINVSGNVVHRGAISRSSSGISAVGPVAMTGTMDNLVSSATEIKAGSVPGATVIRGTLTPDTQPALPDLTAQATYEGLGWNFAAGGAWRWESQISQPAPELADLPPLKQAGIPGAGSSADPYLIDSAADLDVLVQAVNDDVATYGDASVALAADIDYGGADFPGINAFSGDFNGAGHTISGLVYVPSSSSADLGFIRELTGRVRNLNLSDVSAQPTAATEKVAGLATVASGTENKPVEVSLVQVLASELDAPAADLVAGVVAEATGAVVMRENVVDVTVAAEQRAAGVVGVLADGAIVRENLVTARVSVVGSGAAGLVVAAPSGDDTIIRGNVVLDGSVDHTSSTPGTLGRVVGDTGGTGDWTAEENLSNADIEIAGLTVAGPGPKNQHGVDTTSATLALKSTYSSLGWNFVDTWLWDSAAKRPTIKYVLAEHLPNRITNTFYGDPTTQRAFTWYQAIEAEEPSLLLSVDPTFPDSASTTIEATEELSEDGETIYRVIATDLTPGVTHHYRVGDNLTGTWSETGTFITPTGEGDFAFIDLADTQARGGSTEAAVSAATMAKSLATVPDAEFMVHNGDVVQTGNAESDWVDLFDFAQESLLATTIAPVAGNHELETNRFIDHFTLEQPNDQDASTGAYYSYDYNGAHFMMLNTNEGNDRNATGTGDTDYEALSDAQLAWLRADAEAARERGADWLILTMHKGPYTAGSHPTDGDIMSMRERLVPLIDELDIDLVLQGHDHYWSRTEVLKHDPNGVGGAARVPTDVIRESVGGINVEYKVESDGTLYVTPGTAGAKHYGQITDGAGVLDVEAYLDLFDRLGGGTRWGNAGESFLEVRVSDERLLVNRFEIANRGAPVFAEGFGIDRQVVPVDAQLAALPAAAAITLADEPLVRDARKAVKKLTGPQRSYLKNLDRLRAAEDALRVLHQTVSADGSEVAWADATATSRLPITIRNAQRRDLSEVPVRLTIENTPDVDASTLAIATPRSVPLSFEVESWEPGGTSAVWVNMPELAKQSNEVVWAYFGGAGATDNDPSDVWSDHFELVDHFGADTQSGGTRRDSTGKQTGTLVGAELAGRASTGDGLKGGQVTRFDGSRLQYGGDLGGFARNFTVSGVYSLTAADLAAFGSAEVGLFGKQRPGAEAPTMRMSVAKADGTSKTTMPFGGANAAVPVDGKPHLVTMTYDGMTFAVFIDGVMADGWMGENRRIPSEPGVLTTIGDLSLSAEDPNALVAPFRGVVDEMWVASNEFIPEFDAFRAANYFGDAVVYGKFEERANDTLTLAVGNPTDGTEVQAGLVDVVGSLTKRSVVVATIDGETVLEQQVDAGVFTLPVPVNTTGEVEVDLTATSVADPTLIGEATLTLKVTDTVAPADPVVSDERPAGQPLTLNVTPQTDDRERVEARFFTNPSVVLDQSNVVVRTGATADRVPTALTPSSGSVASSLRETTVGDDENPFQIYEISLTPEQIAEGEYHFSWRGTGDDRTVSAWLWDTTASAWVLKESKADAEGKRVNLDVRATAADSPVSADGRMTVLVWRGLTELPWGPDHDYDNTVVSPDDFDWSFNHVGDTQLYTEATPWTMTEQFQYIRDQAEERKTAFVLQAGDWVNREEFEDEWQWLNAEPSANLLEDNEIPYMISWGNHDYNEGRNGRQVMPKYFPMERFEASLEGSPWSFGGSHDVDNYYYTGEIDGAKLLWLTVGYWSANADDDAGLAWAQEVVEAHPDHTVILGTHDYLVANGGGDYSNPRINTLLVDPYPNVKLVLSGHNSGTFVSTRKNSAGERSYGILTDYQTRAWGGHGYLKNLSVDAENGLLHVSTYSPWLGTTTSDGRWNYDMDEATTPGFHGENAENYVLELDLGGVQTRTLSADQVTFSVGEPEQLGDPQTLIGSEPGSVEFNPDLGATQEWFAVLTDRSGNSVTSATRTVRRMQDFPIAYDLVGGTEAGHSNPEHYTADDEPILLSNPTRPGYEFTGWTGTALGSPTMEVTIPTGSTGDRSYAATWRRAEYRLTFDLAGGFLSHLNPSTYHVESDEITLKNPSRGGYEFTGWIGTGLTEPTRIVKLPAGSVGDRVYTAVWTTKAPDAVATSVRIAPVAGGTHGKGTPVSVTVADANGDPVQGEVVLSGAGDPVTARLTDGRAVITVPGAVGAGRHLFSVTYTGNATHKASSSSGVLRIAKAAGPIVKVKVVTKDGRKALRRPKQVLVNLQVPAGVSAPTGTVTIVATGTVKKKIAGTKRFKKVKVTRTRVVPVKAGQFAVALPKGLKPGTWKLTVSYSGSNNHLPAKSGVAKLQIRK